MELSAKLTHFFCWEEIFSGETPSSSNQASHITCDGVSATHKGRSWVAVWPGILLWQGINLLWIVGSASVPNGNASFRTVRDPSQKNPPPTPAPVCAP